MGRFGLWDREGGVGVVVHDYLASMFLISLVTGIRHRRWE